MKKLTALLLILCLLTGCGALPPETEPTTVPVLSETQPPLQNVPGETVSPEPAPPAPGQHQAAFSILENDDSIRNENGDILVNIRYDQVILDTSAERWKTVNDRISQDYRRFLEELSWVKETSPEEWEEQLTGMGYVYGNLLATRSADVTHNSDGIFSIRMTQEWFLGGVFNCDHYGLNFDLSTGEELPLSRLSDLPEEEFAQQLKQIVCTELAEDIDVLFQDPAEVLAEYSLEDFAFYVEEGELVLTFPTYTFGPGAMGSTTIKTGLYPVL